MRIMTFRAPDWMFDYLEQARKESGHTRNGVASEYHHGLEKTARKKRRLGAGRR